ncbi:Hypothetical predicted protein [Lecanosticta acicola]|uniref:Uncharacterized protein n=1 Tax=Lecanosticta acicola TaxID=111012 RepID=A0AAI9E866_9PEZI|nr:Hypothetical predicted protein [Lecanosticta acicola]
MLRLKLPEFDNAEDDNPLYTVVFSILHYIRYLIPILASFSPSAAAIIAGVGLTAHDHQMQTCKHLFNGLFLLFIGMVAGYTNFWLVVQAQEIDGEYVDLLWGCLVGGSISLVIVVLPLVVALGEYFGELQAGSREVWYEEGSWDEGTESVGSAWTGRTLVDSEGDERSLRSQDDRRYYGA